MTETDKQLFAEVVALRTLVAFLLRPHIANAKNDTAFMGKAGPILDEALSMHSLQPNEVEAEVRAASRQAVISILRLAGLS